MARQPKIGLDYFPLDRDFYQDRKIRRILKACGPASGTVLTCLLGNIYYENGYYIRWDEDLPFDIADLLGMSEGSVQEVINVALKSKFFNEELFKKHKILTSVGIQRRYLDILNQLRRSKSHIQKDYWLLGKDVDNSKEPPSPERTEKPPKINNFGKNGINAEEIPIIPEETHKNPEFIPSKLNETKGNEKKGKETELTSAEKDIIAVNNFVREFKEKFGAQFSSDNVASLKGYLIENSYAIAVDYFNIEIFLKTLLRRYQDIIAIKKANNQNLINPISYFFSGINARDTTKRFLLKLTPREEDAGSGYHKPLIRAAEAGKSPIAGLKTMSGGF